MDYSKTAAGRMLNIFRREINLILISYHSPKRCWVNKREIKIFKEFNINCFQGRIIWVNFNLFYE